MRFLYLLLFANLVFANHCESVFSHIWRTHYWGGDSLSGTGSDLIQTRVIREALPILLSKYNCKSMVDAPCGDFYWMKHTDLLLDKYIGLDVVAPMIQTNQILYGNNQRSFIHLDITNEAPPKADLVLCRDCLVHFSYEDISRAIKLFKKSGSKYLLTTSFTEDHPALNSIIETGEWRPLDLRKEPFNFPEPLEIINEDCTVCDNAWNDKSVFLWKIEDLPDLP